MRLTPSAKNPSGASASTAACAADRAQSGLSACGAISASTNATSGGLRMRNARRRSRGVSPARVPNAAPIPKPTSSSTGALTATS